MSDATSLQIGAALADLVQVLEASGEQTAAIRSALEGQREIVVPAPNVTIQAPSVEAPAVSVAAPSVTVNPAVTVTPAINVLPAQAVVHVIQEAAPPRRTIVHVVRDRRSGLIDRLEIEHVQEK